VNVGFLGLGAMGALIVPRLMQAGYTVTGWNRSRDKAPPHLVGAAAWCEPSLRQGDRHCAKSWP